MHAITCRNYGSPEVLRYEEIEKPVPAAAEVLIKVCAASVNPYDWHLMRGTPRFVRLASGLRKPKSTSIGADVAGVIESVGPGVAHLKPGDNVFGLARGAFAEFACASESALALKPDNLTFIQAASVPIAALTALQGLRDKGQLQPGQHVLIHGASGGVGTFAVQIAKALGAHVTAVCGTRNIEMLRSLGADRVLDYTCQDFADDPARYDLFLDCFTNHSLLSCRRVLKPNGVYVVVGGPTGNPVSAMAGLFATVFLALVASRFTSRKLALFIAKGNSGDLTFLGNLMQSGKIRPVIDRTYPLGKLPEAMAYQEQGHPRGKVVIVAE